MPLVIIAGFPCTGKTTVARQLSDFLEKSGIERSCIHLINEESEHIRKRDGYQSATAEKSTRGQLKSAINHKLSSECYVIADSLNYIKGYRYELYCSARTFRTPHCVVWVDCDQSQSEAWNSAREDRYDAQIMADLRKRFEAPDDKNRWDTPLFRINSALPRAEGALVAPAPMSIFPAIENLTLHPAAAAAAESVQPNTQQPSKPSSWKPKSKPLSTTSTASVSAATITSALLARKGEEVASGGLCFSGTFVDNDKVAVARREQDPSTASTASPEAVFPEIAAYLRTALAPPPNPSTVSIVHASPDILYELDRTTKLISDAIVAHQHREAEGTPVVFVEHNRTLGLHRHVGAAEIQRHRRQFIRITSLQPPEGTAEMGAMYIDYLSQNI